MSGGGVAREPAGLALGAGLLPPRLTGCAEPMFVPGAITAMSAASVMYIPAEAARAPEGETKITTGTGAPSIFLMMSRMEVSRPPGVSSAMIRVLACPATALLPAYEH